MKKIMKVVGYIYLTLCLAFIVWLFCSWAEVVSKNMNTNPDYSEYNLFSLMLEYADREVEIG